jgi:hypothetical protein
MRLSCQISLVPLFVLAIACTDSTAPLTVSATFDLQTINGRQVPTYLSAAAGPTTTIFSSILVLDSRGKAEMTEHRSDALGGEEIATWTFDYRITGNKIEIGSFEPCPINANCAPNRIGTISGEVLNIDMYPLSSFGPLIYSYRIAATL